MSRSSSSSVENLKSKISYARHVETVITAPKAHEVFKKMKKIIKGTGGYVNLWALTLKISGLTFVNQNIQPLKYGRDMEPQAINTCTDITKKSFAI